MNRLSLHRWASLSLALWLLLYVGLTQDAARHPFKHNTVYVYHDACVKWWQGQDLYYYNTHQGFFYLPQAAILFTPFIWGPVWLNECLWRAVIFSLFALALARLVRVFFNQADFARTFFLLSLLALPSSLSSLRNGQSDLLIASLNVLAVCAVAEKKWTGATCWLCLGLAIKPLGLVPLLLFGALYTRDLAWRFVVGLLVVALIPFIVATPAYAAHEYARFAKLLLWASQPGDHRFSDLAALLQQVHLAPPAKLFMIVRLAAGPLFLLLGLAARGRCSWPEAAWIIGALAALYLMLFNPRTETCSYVILGPFLASAALHFLSTRRLLSWWLIFSCLGVAADSFPSFIYHATNLWFKPLLALIFFFLLLGFLFSRRRPA